MTDVPGGPQIPPPEGEPPGALPPPPPGQPAPPPGWTLPPPPPGGAYGEEAPLPPLQMPPPSFPDLDERRYGQPFRPGTARVRRARRLPPRFDPLVASVGGVLLFGGMTTLLGELPSKQEWWASAAITAAVLALAVALATILRTGPVISGLLAFALPTAALPASFIVAHEVSSFRVGVAIVVGVPLLLWLAAYFVGPMAGRPILLAAALAALWLLVSAQVAYTTGTDYFGDGEVGPASTAPAVAVLAQATPDPTISPAQPLRPTPQRAPDESFLQVPDDGSATFPDGQPTTAPDDIFVVPQPGGGTGFSVSTGEDSFDPFEAVFGTGLFDAFGEDVTERVGFIALGFGALYLIAAFVLDRRRLAGAGTAFVAVGNVAVVVGVALVAIRYGGWTWPGLALGVGVVLAAVGSSLDRRGTAWLGAVGMFAGLVGIVGKVTDELSDDDSATLEGLLLLGAGLICLVVALAVNRGGGDDVGVDPATGQAYV